MRIMQYLGLSAVHGRPKPPTSVRLIGAGATLVVVLTIVVVLSWTSSFWVRAGLVAALALGAGLSAGLTSVLVERRRPVPRGRTD